MDGSSKFLEKLRSRAVKGEIDAAPTEVDEKRNAPRMDTRPLSATRDRYSERDNQTRIMGPEQEAAAAYREHSGKDLTGTFAGDYLLETILGKGGGGTVYAARHRHDGHACAVKVLLPQSGSGPEMLLRFQREVETLRGLEHPNIVRVLDSGVGEHGWPFFAMELLQGETLWQLLARHQRLSPEECLSLVEPIGGALQAAHAVGIVHRDLKATNVFVHGTPPTVKLLDFGVAKLVRPEDDDLNLTTYGTQIGTLDSMAPEQIRCEPIDARTDIYALGVLMYQILTGHLPFHGLTPEELMQSHLYEPPPRPSWAAPVPPEVDEIVLRCLQKRPSDRFDSIDAALEALRTAVRGTPSETAGDDTEYLAVYIEALEIDEDDDDLEDYLFELIDGATELLAEQGLQVALEVGNTIVGVAPLGTLGLQELCDALERFVDEAEGPARPRAVVHVGEGHIREGQLVGGDLAKLGSWVPHADLPGLAVSRAARAHL